MKNRISNLLALLLCGGLSMEAQARLNIVATTPDLAAIAAEVGGKDVEITTLARPGEDPHFVDPKPSFIVKLNRADVLLHGGAELETGWLPALLAGARNARVVAGAPGNIPCNAGVDMLEIPTELDRSKGDIHAAGNPHYLVDPENARIVAGTLGEAFARLDPASAERYRANAKKLSAALDARIREWRRTLEPFRGAKLVAYHNSWPYFARRFELRIDLFLEPKPGIPPSAAHLSSVIASMKEQDARVVLHDPFLSRRTADMVAKAAGGVVVDVTQYPGGVKGSEGGYIQMMDYVVNAIAKALGDPSRPRANGQ